MIELLLIVILVAVVFGKGAARVLLLVMTLSFVGLVMLVAAQVAQH